MFSLSKFNEFKKILACRCLTGLTSNYNSYLRKRVQMLIVAMAAGSVYIEDRPLLFLSKVVRVWPCYLYRSSIKQRNRAFLPLVPFPRSSLSSKKNPEGGELGWHAASKAELVAQQRSRFHFFFFYPNYT